MSRWGVTLVVLTASVAAGETGFVEQRIARVERGLLPASPAGVVPAPPWNIHDRMRHYRVPGVSVAVIHNFAIDWARGYGVLEAVGAAPVDADTLFQAASISKPVAALGILSLVQDGSLSLDEEANRRLVSWRIPANQLTAIRPVTVRHLLTHMAGTTIVGYVGYAPSQPLPTLVQILNGARPSNSPPVIVDLVPGTQYRYSGGGYTVLQQLAMDVTGVPFAQWMRDEVLDKLEMSRSTFDQPLPSALAGNAASGHYSSGQPIPWKWMTHPELAAAGLWTTASDLARFAIELQKSYAGRSNRVLNAAWTRDMLRVQAPDWGLGPSVLADGNVFTHSGANQGFRSILFAYTHTGDGAAVMTNSDEGGELRMEILRAIAAEYGWPHLRVAGYPAGTPTLSAANGVANAASGRPAVAPGSLVTVHGPGLEDVNQVVFNGIPAAIAASSPDRIAAVLPGSLEPGTAIVQVKRNGLASAGRNVRVERHAPGIFTLDQSGEGPGWIVHADTFRPVTAGEPARRGERIAILCTGLGPGGAQPVVTLGETAARVLATGPKPDAPGVELVDIEVPQDAPQGPAVPVRIRVADVESNVATLAIE